MYSLKDVLLSTKLNNLSYNNEIQRLGDLQIEAL